MVYGGGDYDCEIKRSYWNGSTNASKRVSPIEGTNSNDNSSTYSNATVTNCYYDKTKFTLTTATKATGLTTVQFADKTNFTGFDFENTWIMKDGRPELRIFLSAEEIAELETSNTEE